MSLTNILIIFGIKIISKIIKVLSLGAGSTWPGHIALKLNPHIIKDITQDSQTKIVLIAGTNGKTSTSTLIKYILEQKGFRVLQNEEGANLLNGVASSLIRHLSMSGKLSYDFAIFEIDENTLPQILKETTPYAVLILNLFRDQLDRYGEVNTIIRNWSNSFAADLERVKKSTKLIVNGDDPQLFFYGYEGLSKDRTLFFGAPHEAMARKEVPHDVDSNYCPLSGDKLSYSVMSYSHLGIFHCTCGLNNEDTKQRSIKRYTLADLHSPLKGVYNLYNLTAVMVFFEELLKIPKAEITKLLADFRPAFGRQERIEYKDREIFLLLSKNPTGFNQSIAATKDLFQNKVHNVVVLLNDRIPDGRDVSWIWDVEFQELLPVSKTIFVSGDRTYDMALRFKYCLPDNVEVTTKDDFEVFDKVVVGETLEKTLEYAVNQTPEEETLVVLATYSAMLESRKLLVGKKLL